MSAGEASSTDERAFLRVKYVDEGRNDSTQSTVTATKAASGEAMTLFTVSASGHSNAASSDSEPVAVGFGCWGPGVRRSVLGDPAGKIGRHHKQNGVAMAGG